MAPAYDFVNKGLTPAGVAAERFLQQPKPAFTIGGCLQVLGGDLVLFVGSNQQDSITITAGTTFLFDGYPLHELFVGQAVALGTGKLTVQSVVVERLADVFARPAV